MDKSSLSIVRVKDLGSNISVCVQLTGKRVPEAYCPG